MCCLWRSSEATLVVLGSVFFSSGFGNGRLTVPSCCHHGTVVDGKLPSCLFLSLPLVECVAALAWRVVSCVKVVWCWQNQRRGGHDQNEAHHSIFDWSWACRDGWRRDSSCACLSVRRVVKLLDGPKSSKVPAQLGRLPPYQQCRMPQLVHAQLYVSCFHARADRWKHRLDTNFEWQGDIFKCVGCGGYKALMFVSHYPADNMYANSQFLVLLLDNTEHDIVCSCGHSHNTDQNGPSICPNTQCSWVAVAVAVRTVEAPQHQFFDLTSKRSARSALHMWREESTSEIWGRKGVLSSSLVGDNLRVLGRIPGLERIRFCQVAWQRSRCVVVVKLLGVPNSWSHLVSARSNVK